MAAPAPASSGMPDLQKPMEHTQLQAMERLAMFLQLSKRLGSISDKDPMDERTYLSEAIYLEFEREVVENSRKLQADHLKRVVDNMRELRNEWAGKSQAWHDERRTKKIMAMAQRAASISEELFAFASTTYLRGPPVVCPQTGKLIFDKGFKESDRQKLYLEIVIPSESALYGAKCFSFNALRAQSQQVLEAMMENSKGQPAEQALQLLTHMMAKYDPSKEFVVLFRMFCNSPTTLQDGSENTAVPEYMLPVIFPRDAQQHWMRRGEDGTMQGWFSVGPLKGFPARCDESRCHNGFLLHAQGKKCQMSAACSAKQFCSGACLADHVNRHHADTVIAPRGTLNEKKKKKKKEDEDETIDDTTHTTFIMRVLKNVQNTAKTLDGDLFDLNKRVQDKLLSMLVTYESAAKRHNEAL